MRTVGTNWEVCNWFSEGRKEGRTQNGNIFVEDNTIYSYGSWFPLAVRGTGWYLLNGDKYSVTTSGHQSTILQALRDKENYIIPFSALQAAGLGTTEEAMKYYKWIERKQDAWRTVERTDPKTGETKRYQEHLLGGTVFQYKSRFYLTGTDTGAKAWNGGFFLVQLPSRPDSWEHGLQLLMPDEVRGMQENEYLRQGEFFFVPEPEVMTKDLDKFAELPEIYGTGRYPNNRDLSHIFGNGGNPHVAREVRYSSKGIYARGSVRHPEHMMINLEEVWHRVLINTAKGAWTAIGNID